MVMNINTLILFVFNFRYEQIEKLTLELQETRTDLNSAKAEVKGCKARNHVLEGQMRSLRIDLEDAGMRLNMAKEELRHSMEEVKGMRQELMAAREREKKFRETTVGDLQESNQAVNRVKVNTKFLIISSPIFSKCI